MRGRTGNLRIWDRTIVTPSLLRDVAGARRAITAYTCTLSFSPRDLASGQVFTPRQCGLGRSGQCGFHTRGR